MDAILAPEPSRTSDNPLTLTAALGLGCLALLMLGVQPLILGALVTAGRLDVHLLAQAAMIEMLALGVVSGVLGAVARHRNLTVWSLGGCALFVASNLACMEASGFGLVALRGLAGAAGGALVWITAGVIGRSPSALRLSGIFSGAQALTQAGLAALIPIAAPALGANAGFALLALLGVLSVVFVAAIPRALSELPAPEEGHARLSLPGRLGLAGAFFLMAGIVGVWVFVEQIATQHGVGASAVSLAVALSLVMQIAGAAFITWIGPRASPQIALPLICAAYIACLAVMGLTPSHNLFVGAILVFGFLWTMSLPLFLPLLIGVDPTRRSAMLLAGAQLLGGSAGPLLTGLLVTGPDLQPVLGYGAALFVASAAFVGLAWAARGRA